MRIFLTGATGYIGGAVLEVLARAGHQVTALVRDVRKARAVTKLGATALVGELAAPDAWKAKAAGHDGYVHTAFDGSPRGVETDNAAIVALIALAQQAGVAIPLIYTSRVWVLGATRQPADERAPLQPIPLVAWRPGHERAVLDAAGIRPLVIRSGVVYGGNRGIVGDLFRDGTNGLVRVIGEGRNHWASVYDRDLAELYLRLLTHGEADGVYHATDEADETLMDVVEALGRNTTHKPDVRHIPLEEARAKLGPYADALALDQLVRSPRARALGWTPALKSIAGNIPRLLEEWRGDRPSD
jgi:nucleoside-diphosphate-sugar epimerase